VSAIQLDELDHKIVARLSQDARSSNREIARELDVTEGTIRARIKRLLEDKVIRITAVTNIERLHNAVLAYLWIEVESTRAADGVAKALAALPEITFVSTMLGRSDVLAMTRVPDGDALTRFLHGTIDRIPGIHRTQYTLVHQFVKHDHRWTAIVE
jgi:Lrp/AsnC family transcriptional regulator for asnA, asnC and gidA